MKRNVESGAYEIVSKRQVVSIDVAGHWIVKQPHLNKGNSFTHEERDRLGICGITIAFL